MIYKGAINYMLRLRLDHVASHNNTHDLIGSFQNWVDTKISYIPFHLQWNKQERHQLWH